MDDFERWYWRNAPILYWVPAALYILIIWFASSVPDPEDELLSNSPLRFVISAVPFKDKFQHSIIYFFLGILVMMAMNHTRLPSGTGRLTVNAAVSFLFGAIYGAMDEVHQHFVPARSMDILDLLADLFGLLCGIYLVYILTKEHEGLGNMKSHPRQ